MLCCHFRQIQVSLLMTTSYEVENWNPDFYVYSSHIYSSWNDYETIIKRMFETLVLQKVGHTLMFERKVVCGLNMKWWWDSSVTCLCFVRENMDWALWFCAGGTERFLDLFLTASLSTSVTSNIHDVDHPGLRKVNGCWTDDGQVMHRRGEFSKRKKSMYNHTKIVLKWKKTQVSIFYNNKIIKVVFCLERKTTCRIEAQQQRHCYYFLV